ncbi:hypothetical protein SAMN05421739_102495 [Pontibacter chinhatensis]|uniref:Uncharacterized protein n=2 Tax=Pontibacter chinhatensis TaxID=1436961 RepID=A0A1I2RWM4_9BACT|nr:hypothetical protein SAMN05421739_102495 [Pontibacter chinhatensis]
MKTNKPIDNLDEAIYRASNATKQETQPQNKLHAMRVPQNPNQDQHPHEGAPLNESHVNLMQSWQQLRGLDSKLAQTKYKDMAESPKPKIGRRSA